MLDTEAGPEAKIAREEKMKLKAMNTIKKKN